MQGKKAITCCVIGHRRVEVTDELRRYLKMTILNLIANELRKMNRRNEDDI